MYISLYATNMRVVRQEKHLDIKSEANTFFVAGVCVEDRKIEMNL